MKRLIVIVCVICCSLSIGLGCGNMNDSSQNNEDSAVSPAPSPDAGGESEDNPADDAPASDDGDATGDPTPSVDNPNPGASPEEESTINYFTPECAIWGNAGSTQSCDVHVAAESADVEQLAVGMQLSLTFDPTVASLTEVGSSPSLEFGSVADCAAEYETEQEIAACVQQFLNATSTLPSGHIIVVSPKEMVDWNIDGFGTILLVDMTLPSSELTTAYLNPDGSVEGDSYVLSITFTLEEDVLEDDPILVETEDVYFVAENADNIDFTIEDGIFVTSDTL